MTAALEGNREAALADGGDGLVAWAARSGRPENRGPVRGGLRFVFYGRVSTEDWQDPVTSRARQREQAGALARGHGVIVAEFFDVGQSRTAAWARRPQAAALAAALADPGRGWDAIVIGEYERAFYGSQYAAMAPLFEHYGVQLWMPEAGGRVDYGSEHDEQAMTVLGLSSKREITRTSIRVRTAMAALLVCGTCERRMESAWSNGKAAYRCRHGHTSATRPDPCRAKNAYIREDRILPHLPALHLLLIGAEAATRHRRRMRRGADARPQAGAEDVIRYLHDRGITLTYDPAAGTLQAGTCEAAKTIIRKAS